MKTCFLIGHRDVPNDLREKLEKAIDAAITEHGIEEFVVGHLGGFDRLAVGCLAEAKDSHPELRLILLLPYHPSDRHVDLPRGFVGETPNPVCVLRHSCAISAKSLPRKK